MNVIPLYLATAVFDQQSDDNWYEYIKWSGLSQLREVVSLDGMLDDVDVSDVVVRPTAQA